MEKGKKNEELFCGMPVPAYHLFCKSHDDYDIFCADRVSGHRKKETAHYFIRAAQGNGGCTIYASV